MVYLLFVVASLFGSALAWRALRETCPLLVAGVGPLLGASALVALSNARVAPSASLAVLTVASLLLVALPGRQKVVWIPIARWQGAVLLITGLVVLAYTQYHQVHVLDGDRWLHDAQIVAFQRGVYPPVNPLFPDLAMNGHFGRDLLMATLTEDGTDPAYTTWWVTPWLQLATFLTLFASTRLFTNSNGRGLLVSSMVFFGMDCGFRVGLIDTYDGSNGLAYPHLVLLIYLMNRVLQGSRLPVWLVAGVVLGTYQLVYMTSFALLLVTGFAVFCLRARTKAAWLGLLVTGLLAMGLAVTEGGAFTDMASRGLKPKLDRAVQNQGLRVTVQFPKEHLFQVMTSTAGYQRTSVAYQTSFFKGLYQVPRGDGYMYLWDPRFMRTHWLPLYLAPLSLWLVRRSALGLSFWLFGFISYLLPGLVYFGPIFEHEYFRWEFSAAFGFAAALGLALGEWLGERPILFERQPLPRLTFGPGSGRYIFAIAVTMASLLAGEQAVNHALIAAQKRDFRAFPSVRDWRLTEPTFALSEDILAGCSWLRQRSGPGQQVLTNFLNDRPNGLWPDVVSATLAGVFPAGHAYPSETEGGPHGNPAFHQNSVYRSFWATGDTALLEQTRVRFLLADTRKLEPRVLKILQSYQHQLFGTCLAVALPERPTTTPRSHSDWSVKLAKGARVPDEDLRLGSRYPLIVDLFNHGEESRATLLLNGGLVEPLTFTLPKGDSRQEWSFVTPLDEGSYKATVVDSEGVEKLAFAFQVDFLKRLEALSAKLELGQFYPGRLYTLAGQWVSPSPIHYQGMLDVLLRFKRADGEYDWSVDPIAQAVDFNLPAEPRFSLQMLTPFEPGTYAMEIWFFDRGSGRRVRSSSTLPLVVIP